MHVIVGHLLNELPQQSNFLLDGVVIGDDAFKCAYIVNVAGKGSLGFEKLGLEINERRRCERRR